MIRDDLPPNTYQVRIESKVTYEQPSPDSKRQLENDLANLEIASMICKEFGGDFAGPCEFEDKGLFTLEARFLFIIKEQKSWDNSQGSLQLRNEISTENYRSPYALTDSSKEANSSNFKKLVDFSKDLPSSI